MPKAHKEAPSEQEIDPKKLPTPIWINNGNYHVCGMIFDDEDPLSRGIASASLVKENRKLRIEHPQVQDCSPEKDNISKAIVEEFKKDGLLVNENTRTVYQIFEKCGLILKPIIFDKDGYITQN